MTGTIGLGENLLNVVAVVLGSSFVLGVLTAWSLYLTGKVKEKKASKESIHGSSSAALSTFI